MTTTPSSDTWPSRRIGSTDVKPSIGNEARIETPWPAPAFGALNSALAPGVAVQRCVEPNSPMKHSARSLGPGPVTVALTFS